MKCNLLGDHKISETGSNNTCYRVLLYCSTVYFQSYELPGILAEAQESVITSKFIIYNGSKYGVSIQYPDNWITKEASSGVWFMSPVNESGNVRIESQASQNISLTEIVQFQCTEL